MNNTVIAGRDENGTVRPVRVDTDGKLDVGLTFDGNLTIGTVGIDQTTPGTTNGVAVTTSALPTGAATETTLDSLLSTLTSAASDIDTKQAAGNGTLSTINGKITACNTGAVVIAGSALPSGAATAAKQPSLGTAGSPSADVISVQGVANGTALPVSGTVTASLAGGSRVNSSEYEVSRVLSSAACRLISLFGYNAGPAQFLHLYDATAAPADGAAPVFVIGIPSQSSFGIDFGAGGLPFSTGCVVSNSTTGPVRTAGSANCFFTAVKI